jgi:hypothetical protein
MNLRIAELEKEPTSKITSVDFMIRQLIYFVEANFAVIDEHACPRTCPLFQFPLDSVKIHVIMPCKKIRKRVKFAAPKARLKNNKVGYVRVRNLHDNSFIRRNSVRSCAALNNNNH